MPRWVKRHRRLRQAVIQARKRSIFDLGPLLGVAPFAMAKANGAFLAAEARAAQLGPADESLATLAQGLLTASGLARIEGGAWGYEFDVQTRWAYYPEGSPNLIATVFVGRGFLEAGLVAERADWLDQGLASARYLMDGLRDARGHFRYTTDSDRLIHNANLLGAGLVAVCGRLCDRGDWLDAAREAALLSVTAQRDDGTWPYGEGDALGWVDNFHTAYDLDGLSHVLLATRDGGLAPALESGTHAWSERFFGGDGAPGYYIDRRWPQEVHCAGTAVDVAARLSLSGLQTLALARAVMAWTDQNLIDRATGATYYRRSRLLTDRRHFVRWGDAHVALGRSALDVVTRGRSTPIEDALTSSGHSADE